MTSDGKDVRSWDDLTLEEQTASLRASLKAAQDQQREERRRREADE